MLFIIVFSLEMSYNTQVTLKIGGRMNRCVQPAHEGEFLVRLTTLDYDRQSATVSMKVAGKTINFFLPLSVLPGLLCSHILERRIDPFNIPHYGALPLYVKVAQPARQGGLPQVIRARPVWSP